MAEGQDPALFIRPGDRADGAHGQVPRHEGYPDGAARLQVRHEFRRAGNGRLRNIQPLPSQVPFQDRQGLVRETAGQKPRPHGQAAFPGGRREQAAARHGRIQQGQHGLDGLEETVARIVKGLAEGDSPGQPAVQVDGTAAHALGDAAAAFHDISAGLDQDLVPLGIIARDAQHFHGEGFNRIALQDRFGIARHARADLFHRQNGRAGGSRPRQPGRA